MRDLYSYDAKEACEDPAEIECSIDDVYGNGLELCGKIVESGMRSLYLLPIP
jgi:hypothetical protein